VSGDDDARACAEELSCLNCREPDGTLTFVGLTCAQA
jgi:hypothetical protein